MSDTEIETTIRRLLLFKQSVNNNKENEIHVKDIQKQLITICEKFHFFYKKILSNKNFNYEKLILEIIKNLEFVYKKENEVIWNVGDKVNEMYIIFLGEINIYKYQNKNDDEEPQLDYILEKGYTLGEDSLKNNSIRRTYLAKSRSFCILGKLSLKEYNRIFSRLLNEENILINSFLRDLKMFSNDFIDRFKKNVLINYYNKNDYIFKQNESFRTFYFIYSGTVRLILKLNKTVKSKLDYDILIGKDPKQRFSNSRLFELRGNYKETFIAIIIIIINMMLNA
jgi:signal-transduction protein with cAMP-binding, CBS, and nucleotidyltransferase domain